MKSLTITVFLRKPVFSMLADLLYQSFEYFINVFPLIPTMSLKIEYKLFTHHTSGKIKGKINEVPSKST